MRGKLLTEWFWCQAKPPDRRPQSTQVSPLRQRMSVRNFSASTQRSYVYHVWKFSEFFGKRLRTADVEDVRAYQVHLISRGISWWQLNQTVSALRFFFGVTMGRSIVPKKIPYGRRPRSLPVVLSAEEVSRFLAAVQGVRNRMVLTLAYAVGLRISEATRLKVSNIDSKRGIIRV